MKIGKLGIGILVLVIAVAAIFFLGNLAGPQDDPAVAEQFSLASSALAATENLDTDQAEPLWGELNSKMPGDESVLLNRALNRVLRVDALTESTTNALLDADTKQAARKQLPKAIEQAREASADYVKASQDRVVGLWLDSRIDLHEASLLPASLAKSIRQQVFTTLIDAIQGDLPDEPNVIILGGPLMRVIDELESPISGLPAEILPRAATATAALSNRQPDNLFIALRAGRLGLAAKSEAAAEPIERTQRLASAIEPSLRVSTQSIGLTPDELVQKILDAVKSQDWQNAENQMNLWFNVLNGTDLVKTDRRRSSPHPLDKLSFEILRRLSVPLQATAPVQAGTTPLKFEPTSPAMGTDVAAAIPLDFDLDLIPDVVSVSKSGVLTVWKRMDEPEWTSQGELDLKMSCAGLIAADLFMVDASDPKRIQASQVQEVGGMTGISSSRHNTFPTLLVYGSEGVKLVSVDGRPATKPEERLTIVEGDTGLEDLSQVTTAIAGDLEGDGDLDLVIATKDRGLRLFVNRGNRTFFELGRDDPGNALAGLTNIADMAIVDLDRDLDLDVVTIDSLTGKVGLLENLLHLQFRHREIAEIPATPGASQVAIADIDGNVSWDIVVGVDDATRIVYTQTADTGAWVVERVESLDKVRGNFLLSDLDNDSWQELTYQASGKLQTIRLAGAALDKEVTTSLDTKGKAVAAADFDLDGKLDVLTLGDGQWQTHRNVTESDAHHLAVRFRGIDDNNANSGRVNHYAIGSVVEVRFGPHYRAQVITTPTTHFGLDGIDKAASLRVIFPNGLTQMIREPAIDTLVEEEQTLKGSCPYLYAWDGEKFAFVTDCLWAAPLGLQVAAGVVAKDRPWEYLKVDGDYVKEKDGHYELRITEELWEVAYFDHVALTAVDHPAEVEIQTNEKVGPAEIAKPTIFAFERERLLKLKSGVDTRGSDVTEKLKGVDQTYVQGFDRRLRQGLCPPHWIDLDFGPLPTSSGKQESVYLVLTGWILPTDTSLNIQIDQNPELPAIEFPSVWVPDASEADGWRKAIPFMGFPGGKTKTIVVDVTDVLNRGDPRLRVRTSAQIYWDAAQLAIEGERPGVTTHEIELVEAGLGYHGFSRRSQALSTNPDTYDHAAASKAPKWPPLQGRFSNYGRCDSLLESWDDRMLVMGSGDELRLKFKVPDEGPPAGWKRDFILHCVGWDKDADLNTLTGQSSMPLPFKGMSEYPPRYSESERLEKAMTENAEHLHRTQSYREFWHR